MLYPHLMQANDVKSWKGNYSVFGRWVDPLTNMEPIKTRFGYE